MEESAARRRELEEELHRVEEETRNLERRLARFEGSLGVLALSDRTAEAAGVPTSKTFYRRPTPFGPDGTMRHPGGQPGHKGVGRKRPAPNRSPLEITLDRCPTTGVRLPPPADWLGRTFTDLPRPAVDVYEERRRLKHHLGRPWSHPDAVRIAKELTLRLDMVFSFVLVPGVPWHSNDAELQIRQGVLHRKVSGTRRSWGGAKTLARLASVYRTCKKTGERFTGLVRDVYTKPADRAPAAPSRQPQT